MEVGVDPTLYFNNVILVKGLGHNLLNISKLGGRGYNVFFSKDQSVVRGDKNNIFSTKGQENLCK